MRKSFVILILTILLLGCQKSNPQKGNAELVIITIGATITEEVDLVGVSVLDILEKNHEVKLTYGKAIKCIDNVCAESGYWWPLSVNGKISSYGVESYIVKNNDKIEIVLRKK